MARTVTGVDVGTSSAKLLRGAVKGTSFIVTDFTIVPSPEHDIAQGWSALEPDFKLQLCRVGLTGRDVNIRYTRVPRVADWQLRRLMRFEAEEVGGQSEAAVASDFNVLPEIPEIEGEDVVVLCMARESLLEQHLDGLEALKGQLDCFTPNAIALFNAFLHYGVVMEDTVLVANIGRESTDVALMRGTDLLFARNLSGGSKLFDEALAQRFQIGVDRAERYKIDSGTLDTARFADANQEKAGRALMAPAGQILSLLQSAVLFCKSQIKLTSLKLDRVFVCGGGAALGGLPEYLGKAMGVPVEIFDPFIVVDATKLDPESAAELEQHRHQAVIALGLATTGSDPDAYSIEILPERVRKRRDFVQGTAFLIAAAVLAIAYLGFFTWRKSAELSALEAQSTRLESEFRRAKRHDQQTRALIEENEVLASYGQQLFALAGSGEQLVRTLDSIERHLPQDFWLETLTSAWGADDELAVARDDERPILRLKGRAREGTDTPALLFQEFVTALREDLPEAHVKERMGDTASVFTLDVTALAAVAPESTGATDAATTAEDPAENGGEPEKED
jgi:Tfp pilus assembly PilM family ATPase